MRISLPHPQQLQIIKQTLDKKGLLLLIPEIITSLHRVSEAASLSCSIVPRAHSGERLRFPHNGGLQQVPLILCVCRNIKFKPFATHCMHTVHNAKTHTLPVHPVKELSSLSSGKKWVSFETIITPLKNPFHNNWSLQLG